MGYRGLRSRARPAMWDGKCSISWRSGRFPVDEVAALASSRSLGMEVEFGNTQLPVDDIANFNFDGWDIALFAIGSAATAEYAPAAADSGCTVIDNSSLYRYDPDVPLVVPEVNPDAVEGFRERNIIANPNCSTAQMVVVLNPLHQRARIRRVVVSTYQSVSGSGKAAMDELWNQTKAMYNPGEEVAPSVYPSRIAFNVIPHIDSFLEDGSTREEWKMVAETKKIVDPEIEVSATCVRVPVFVGHSEAVNIEFEEHVDEAEAREILRAAPGVVIVDERRDGGYATPDGLRRRIRNLRQPVEAGSNDRQRPQPVVRLRQPQERGGAQRGSDSRTLRAAHPSQGMSGDPGQHPAAP